MLLFQKSKGKKGNGLSTPFRRIEGDVEVDPRLVDNSFEAKVREISVPRLMVPLVSTHYNYTCLHTQAGSRGSWGEKANKDLKYTKGEHVHSGHGVHGTSL